MKIFKIVLISFCLFILQIPLQASTLLYSTYLGGSLIDQAQAIAIDNTGHVYITGNTSSTNYPVKSGAYDTSFNNGSADIFITKLDTTTSGNDSLVYSTYIGSYSDEFAYGMAVDNSGNAYITGYSTSTSYPLTPSACDSIYQGGQDVVVTKINATGSSLLYSTYLGGSLIDQGYAIAVDTSEFAYITGVTQSTTFQVTSGAFSTAHAGVYDIFISKINTLASGTASLLYSTYLGGNTDDGGRSIAVDSAKNVYITGYTLSSDFPATTTAFNKIAPGYYNGFILKLNTLTSGTAALLYSSFLGGTQYDYGKSIAIDNVGNAYITGYSKSTNFPVTANAYDTTYHGGLEDAFVSKFNTLASGSASLVYSTFLGGDADDMGISITTDTAGNAYITGYTKSTVTFPITSNGIQTTYSGGVSKTFISKINTLSAGTSSLVYSSFIGGSGTGEGHGIAVDTGNIVYITGYTFSTDFQTSSNAFDTTYNGGAYDAFVSKINLTLTVPIYDWMMYSNDLKDSKPLIGNKYY